MNFQKPFDDNFRITQKFGAKYLYFGKEQFHRGLDFACPKGTPLRATHAGKVIRAKRDDGKNGYGWEVRIQNGDILTQYAHLSGISVAEGGEVQVGDLIGLSGNTGYCLGVNGEHLHFGVHQSGKWVDPLPFLADALDPPPAEEDTKPEQNPSIPEGETVEGSDTAHDENTHQKFRKRVLEDASLTKQNIEKCFEIFAEMCDEVDSRDDALIFRAEFEKRVKAHFQI